MGLGCRARQTRLSLQSERLSPVVCNTGSVSALHLGGALGQSAPCSPEKWTHSFSADKEKRITLQRQLDLRHSKSETFKSGLSTTAPISAVPSYVQGLVATKTGKPLLACKQQRLQWMLQCGWFYLIGQHLLFERGAKNDISFRYDNCLLHAMFTVWLGADSSSPKCEQHAVAPRSAVQNPPHIHKI